MRFVILIIVVLLVIRALDSLAFSEMITRIIKKGLSILAAILIVYCALEYLF